MKQFEPSFYKDFSCIADRCKHSCCVGWEIDIDAETLKKYESVSGELGEKLRRSVVKEGGSAHFSMCEHERCPFLNEKNLCEIILELGENFISQICTDHPRFYNEFSGRVEAGLGLCCEEAARIILEDKEKFCLVQTEGGAESEEEEEFFTWREELFEFVQDRKIPFSERLAILSDIRISNEIISLFKGLEVLDEAWREKLSVLEETEEIDFCGFDLYFEKLLLYFLYRHTPNALYDGGYVQREAFSVLSVLIINEIFKRSGEQTKENLIEISRMYSAEIEYSEENTRKILEKLLCIL